MTLCFCLVESALATLFYAVLEFAFSLYLSDARVTNIQWLFFFYAASVPIFSLFALRWAWRSARTLHRCDECERA